MDLELIIRAIWRRRIQVLLAMVLVGLAVPIGVGLLVSPQYSSATDVTVFPATDVDSAAGSTYQLQPDRFVATQVAVLASRQQAARVAQQLKLSTNDVLQYLTVEQLEKSDVIRVTATTDDAKLSARIASAITKNYVDDVTASTGGAYAAAVQSVDDQLKGIQAQIDAIQSQIKQLGQSASDPGPLQSQLNSLVSQQTSLSSQREKLLIDSKTLPTATRVVSNAEVDPQAVGTGRLTLAIYGAVLGLGLATTVIALRTSPARSIEGIEAGDEVDGVDVLGTVDAGRGPTLGSVRTGRRMRHARIAADLRKLLRQKGEMVMVGVGPVKVVGPVARELGVLVATGHRDDDEEHHEIPARHAQDWFGLPEDHTRGVYVVDTLDEFLALDDIETLKVAVAVDVRRVTRPALLDAIATITSSGAEVLAVVGVRR